MDDHLGNSPVDWDNIDYEGISEFMQKKGAVELLGFLNEYGYRFEEIDDALDLSRGYVNKRKDEAFNLDLIYPAQRKEEGEIRRTWALSQLGMIIIYKMERYDLRKELFVLLSAREDYEESKEQFLDWSEMPKNIEETVIDLTNGKDIQNFDIRKLIRETP